MTKNHDLILVDHRLKVREIGIFILNEILNMRKLLSMVDGRRWLVLRLFVSDDNYNCKTTSNQFKCNPKKILRRCVTDN